MQLFNRQVSARGMTVFGIESLLIPGSIVLATKIDGSLASSASNLWKTALITTVCELCLYYNDLYDLTLVHSPREMVSRLLQATGTAAIVVAAACLTVPWMVLDPNTFTTALTIYIAAVIAWRATFGFFARDCHLEERLLILGTGGTAATLARQIATQHDFPYKLVGFLQDGDDRHQTAGHECDGAFAAGRILGHITDLDRLVVEQRIDRIVVAISDRRGHLPIEPLLRAKLSGIRVEDATTTYERLTEKILIDDLKPSWLVFSDGFRASNLTRGVKRALDLVLAVTASIVAAPLMAGTVIALQLESSAPILYRQERVGENGRVFTLYKFRSMHAEAETGTPVWARDGDDRVTPVGRWLRSTRLDELPQLWNVVRGDMSFVGPRPERPYFVVRLAKAIPFYVERHSVKPGITGWAQVKYRYGSSVEDATEKLRYDLYYIKHLSVVFDLTIVVDTIKVMLFRKGAK